MEELKVVNIADSTCKEPIYVLSEVYEIYDEMVANRRWFHANPELSFEEYNTAAKVADLLRSYGIEEIYEGIGKTGVVGIIRGENGDGPCVGLRADMDALPIIEAANVSYKSTKDGVMHACGHDGHMTILLAAAKLLMKMKSSLKGSVKLIFQPAEEGYAGALAMMKDGCLEEGACGPKVDQIYGLHLWSVTPLGNIECQLGPVMAASDRFDINVKGKGGHGAMPAGTVDAIVEAAALVTALQTIVSRNMDPLQTAVVTCGTIKGGFGYNIIADSVQVCGTCRTFTPENRSLIQQKMSTICCGVASTYGGEIDLKYTLGYPPTVNAYPICNEIVINAASRFVGPTRAAMPQCTMGAEDFSYFLEQRPGCFFFVGGAKPGDALPHHKSIFEFDERALLIGASTFVQIIKNILSSTD